MRLCIVGSCGKKKLTTHPNSPTCKEIQSRDNLLIWQEQLSDYCRPAREMYTGNQAKQLVKGVDLLRKIDDVQVDLFIISAGFGFLREEELVPPYECTFAGMSKKQLSERTQQLNINEDFLEGCVNQYDLLYLALGKNYFSALGSNWLDHETSTVIQFVEKNLKPNIVWFPSGNETVKALSANGYKVHGASGFKGDFLRILASYALSKTDPYGELAGWTDPYYLKQLFSDLVSSVQLTL